MLWCCKWSKMERAFMYRKKALNSYQWNSQSSALYKNLVGSYYLYTIAMQPLLWVLLRDCWFKYWYVFWMIKHQSLVSKLLLCYIFLFIEQHLFQGPNCVVIEVQAAKFQLPNCCPVCSVPEVASSSVQSPAGKGIRMQEETKPGIIWCFYVRASPLVLSMWPCGSISHIQA
jgi:hypothetical protein